MWGFREKQKLGAGQPPGQGHYLTPTVRLDRVSE